METEELARWCQFIRRYQAPILSGWGEKETHRDLLTFHLFFALVDKFTIGEIWGALPLEYRRLTDDTPDLWVIRWWLEDWIEEVEK